MTRQLVSQAESYIEWIRKTLERQRGGLEDGELLALLVELTERFESGKSVIFGAVIAGDVYDDVREGVLPELTEEIALLRSKGLGPVQSEVPLPLWSSFSRQQARALSTRLTRLPGHEWIIGPYRRIARHGVGGLRAVGFARGTEYLLVLSSRGRGVFDCASGERVGRDERSVSCSSHGASVPGIPPIPGVEVEMMGIDGGRPLPRRNRAGWQLGVLNPDWRAMVWLCPPGMPIEEPSDGASVLTCGFEELRAAGFSDSGSSLVFAEQHSLHIFREQG